MAPSLFSSADRVDRGPAPYAISEYDALDQAADPAFGRVRRALDSWLERVPPHAQPQICQRFVTPDDEDHRGALLELYLHELYRSMGYEVDIDVGNDANGQRRPDFLLAAGGHEFYVEATALAGDEVGDPIVNQRLDEIHDAVNAVTAPAFAVDMEITAHGNGTSSSKKVTKAVQRFLDEFDPDELLKACAAGAPRPHRVITIGGWTLSLTAEALAPEHRDYPGHRVLGGRFSGVDSLDDLTPIRRKLRKKATHYGQLGKPYVVALLCAGTFVDDSDINKALMGSTAYWYDHDAREPRGARQRDGVWMGPRGPVNTRLSGVLTFRRLSASAVAAVEPTLWVNPWAEHPLTDPGPWRQIEFHPTGQHVEHPATGSAARILGLSDGWPYEQLRAAA